MRVLRMLLFLAITCGVVFGQADKQKGIETGDLNRTVDPCTDFYEFANGTWRSNNPIPPSMPRWSRRWAAGEMNKEQLKGILDEVTGKEWPKSSVEQLIGDYYGSCMDEASANKLGVKSIEPLLADIDGMKNAADVQRMIRRFHELAINVPFGLAAASDNHNPTQVIAEIYASGLDFPTATTT